MPRFGEPVTEHDDLFGAAVQVAARICAACEPGSIWASRVVKDLSMGKNLTCLSRGEQSLPGLDELIHLYELRWKNGAPAA